MPLFAYRAVETSGRIASGEHHAANENELAFVLKESGLELITAHEKNASGMVSGFVGKTVPLRTLEMFFARTFSLLTVGLPFLEALNHVQNSLPKGPLADALPRIAQRVSNGTNIADAFALFPKIFPRRTIALLAAGEQSGDMAIVFRCLAEHAAWEAALRERLVRSLRYPLFLLFVAGGAVFFMMGYVVPQIALFLDGLHTELPWTTRFLLAATSALTAWGGPLLLFCSVGVTGLFFLRKIFYPCAEKLDALVLKLPWIGSLALKISIARFAQTFSLLLNNGCDIVTGLRHAKETLNNRALIRTLTQAERQVTEGQALSAVLENFLPPLALGLVRLGETHGQLPKSFDDMAALYTRDVSENLEGTLRLLEPALTLVIGGLLALTVLAVMGPLYGSLSVLSGGL